ncbi:hypothetical protein [Streptomyces sp. NRRL F-5630]|uniref:hypothetical protein n=1 Tax=Streptomyces sp. NRRL F-5630 TaxID=1463864 RepID=UPI0004CAB829|nr:hypothetical protein [Streptomyces sp. NRRL F-5630]
MSRLADLFHTLSLRAYLALQRFAEQEPVRLRSALTSAVLALAFVIPSISAPVAEQIGMIGAVALPILVGESTRAKVSPTKDDE